MPKRQTKKLPAAVELPSGAYRCQVLVDGKRLSFTAPTAAEAQQLALIAKAGGEVKKKSSRTVGDAVDDYIASREAVLSPSTIRSYKIMRRNRMQSVMDKPIGAMTDKAWQAAINAEVKSGKNAKYVANVWGLIRPAIEMEIGHAPSVRLPQKVKNTRPFLDDEQVKVFMRGIQGDDAEVAALLAMHSLRRSEIMGLTWKDIDLANDTISVNGAVVIAEGNVLVRKKETKTASSRRTIQILIPRLKELLLAEQKQGNEPVVTIQHLTLYKHINRVCEDNGLPLVGIHGLRHTFASIGFFLHIPARAIQEMGGWSDQRVLMDIYTHLSSRQERKYTEQFREFFGD